MPLDHNFSTATSAFFRVFLSGGKGESPTFHRKHIQQQHLRRVLERLGPVDPGAHDERSDEEEHASNEEEDVRGDERQEDFVDHLSLFLLIVFILTETTGSFLPFRVVRSLFSDLLSAWVGSNEGFASRRLFSGETEIETEKTRQVGGGVLDGQRQ